MEELDKIDIKICPICKQECKFKINVCTCVNIEYKLLHNYDLIYMLSPTDNVIVQVTTIFPFKIATIIGDDKSKVYLLDKDVLFKSCDPKKNFMVNIDRVSYRDLENHEVLIKRLNRLVIFS